MSFKVAVSTKAGLFSESPALFSMQGAVARLNGFKFEKTGS